MNSLIENEDEATLPGQRDREITLGTTTILGIFFALAVLCAGFFGFGYSLGSKHTAVTESAAEPVSGAPSAIFNGFKPAAGKQPAAKETLTVPVTSDLDVLEATPAVKPGRPQANSVAKAVVTPIPNEGVAASRKAPAPNAAPNAAPNTVASTVASTVAGTASVTVPGAAQSVVQIAAVTHQEDADLIASTLKRRGYSVNIRQEPQDKLLHVQVGPFASKKDAEAMRQRLLADGFNAYLK